MFYNEAIDAFNQAINQREKDQWMARIYGYHFVDYFPHREKGICFYEVGNFDRAKQELENSINTEPTEKAYFYLDKVRIKLMEVKNFRINRNISEVYKLKYRFKLELLSFDNIDTKNNLIEDYLLKSIIRQKRFQVNINKKSSITT